MKNIAQNTKSVLTISIVVMLSIFAKAENPCNVMLPLSSDTDWGIGGYAIPDTFSLNVYSEETNAIKGVLRVEMYSLMFFDKEIGRIQIDQNSLTHIGHYIHPVLKVKECFNPKYEQVFWHGHDEVFYIDKSEAKAAGAEFSTFRSLLAKYPKDSESDINFTIGVNLQRSCLNLRENPEVSDNKIICVMSNDWESNKFTTQFEVLELQKNWARVKYFELHPETEDPTDNEDCYFMKKNEKVGWLKAIDDNGFPNIWFSVTGY